MQSVLAMPVTHKGLYVGASCRRWVKTQSTVAVTGIDNPDRTRLKNPSLPSTSK